MSANKYNPHLVILPEDDANRQLVNGFLKDPALNLRRADVLPEEGGWFKVREAFQARFVAYLQRYPLGHLVLLIDFDDQVEDRTTRFREIIPDSVSNRVYLLGSRSEPEPLRKACGFSLEKIGERLAHECATGRIDLWKHALLKHNQPELDRLEVNVKPFLFD